MSEQHSFLALHTDCPDQWLPVQALLDLHLARCVACRMHFSWVMCFCRQQAGSPEPQIYICRLRYALQLATPCSIITRPHHLQYADLLTL